MATKPDPLEALKHTITFTFELRGEGDHDRTRGEIAATLRASIEEDFCQDAWGGYDGPGVLALEVEQHAIKLNRRGYPMHGPDMTKPEGRAGLTARLNWKTEIVDGGRPGKTCCPYCGVELEAIVALRRSPSTDAPTEEAT